MFQGIFLNGFGITDHFPLLAPSFFFRHGTAANDPEKNRNKKREKIVCINNNLLFLLYVFLFF